MSPAIAGHLVVDIVLGLLILKAYRYVRGRAALAAHVMAIGVISRAAIGSTLFWISYLDLSFLRTLHYGDGFWVGAPDARRYYDAAAAVANGFPADAVTASSPAFVRALSMWMQLVGWSPASGAFLNLGLFTVLCVVLVRAAGPPLDRAGQRICAACLFPFSVAPVLLVHSSQALKDDMFVFCVVLVCLSVMALLRTSVETNMRSAAAWRLPAALAVLFAAVSVVSGIRLYFTAMVLAGLVPAVGVYVWRSKGQELRRRVAVAVATLVAASIAPVYLATPTVRRWIAPPPAPLAAPMTIEAATPAPNGHSPGPQDRPPARPLRGGLVLWDYALTSLREARLSVEHLGGASRIAARPTIDNEFARPAMVGIATIWVPISLARAAGWIDLSGGRGLLWVTDIDTLFLDLAALVSMGIVARYRSRLEGNVPFVCLLVGLALLSSVLLGFVVTNFGLLFRLRVMADVPLWLLPLAVCQVRRARCTTPEYSERGGMQ